MAIDINPSEIPDIKICDVTGKKYWAEFKKCDCPCHESGNSMMHIVPCCDNGKIEIRYYVDALKEEIEKLKDDREQRIARELNLEDKIHELEQKNKELREEITKWQNGTMPNF